MKAKYVNPYTDFGFKKLFGEEASKDLLKDFLNQLLPPRHQISDLTFKNPEKLSDIPTGRNAVFDIHCQSDKGDRFIVEMQKAEFKYFKDRAIFYTTFPITEQAEKGRWNFKLTPVYCVALLDFTYDDDREEIDYIRNVQLKDDYCQVFSNKLTYIFIEMPRFEKQEHQLENHFDKWLYFLKNLESFDHIPAILNEEVFIRGFEIAEIANFDEKQMAAYEHSLKVYRDLWGVMDTQYEKGRVDEKTEIARMMKEINEPLEKISKLTGLSIEEIEAL